METSTRALSEPRVRRGPASLVHRTRTAFTAPSAPIREVPATDHVAQRDRRYRNALVLADLLSACLALLLCVNVLGQDRVSPAILLALPLVVLASKLYGLYDRDGLVVNKTTVDEAPKLFQLATLYTLVVWLGDGVFINGEMGADQALVLWMSLWSLGLVFRRIARGIAGRRAQTERLLLIGDAPTYTRLAEKLELSMVDARLVARMSMQRLSDAHRDERPLDERQLRALIADLDVHRVLVVPSQSNPQATYDIVRATKATGVRVSIVPRVFDVVGSSVVFDDIAGMTILGVRQFGLSRTSRAIKRTFDVIGASVGLFFIAPLFLAIALAVKLDSRGPVFFRQERVGRGGQRFRIFKFRTMVADAEQQKHLLAEHNEANGLFKMADDPRVTRVGRLLRKTSLDELPQLLNVLKAEMSLVGPRPLIASEDETITGYDRRRLHLTPGMTGHWQIMGSARVPLHEMVKIDYLYVTSWSLLQDFKILVRTVPYMLARRGM